MIKIKEMIKIIKFLQDDIKIMQKKKHTPFFVWSCINDMQFDAKSYWIIIPTG